MARACAAVGFEATGFLRCVGRDAGSVLGLRFLASFACAAAADSGTDEGYCPPAEIGFFVAGRTGVVAVEEVSLLVADLRLVVAMGLGVGTLGLNA